MMCTPATWEAHHFHHAIDTLNFSLINQRYASHIDPRWDTLSRHPAHQTARQIAPETEDLE